MYYSSISPLSTHLTTKIPGAKVDCSFAATVKNELIDVNANSGQSLAPGADLLVGNSVTPMLHIVQDFTQMV